MRYKVFLVEDEIVAREGIRDNVDWRAAGFEFCGEASDGEIALPLVETVQPDLLITDIKMPFMDGLQLSKVVRERLPAVKIVILSGHDEFQYAQDAIKLGVSEYLLKPVSVRDLQALLERMATQLAHERRQQENLLQLQSQVDHNLPLLRERFLLRLVTGGVTPLEAIEQSDTLGLALVAPAYQVLVAKASPRFAGAAVVDYGACAEAWNNVRTAIQGDESTFAIQKDLDELILLLKGPAPAAVAARGEEVASALRAATAGMERCCVRVATGTPQQRLSDIPQSLGGALIHLQNETRRNLHDAIVDEGAGAELLRLDRNSVELFLKFGEEAGFPTMFAAFTGVLSPQAQDSHLIKSYLYLELVLAAAHFVRQLGGNAEQVLPELDALAMRARHVHSLAQLGEEIRRMYANVLAFRDLQHGRVPAVLLRARAYIEAHFQEPGLSLQEVADHLHLSANHFSAVFSGAAGETFKETVTRLRIERARELLRTTALNTADICYAVGYSDPHYFSAAFKKATGLSPRQFRSPADPDAEERTE